MPIPDRLLISSPGRAARKNILREDSPHVRLKPYMKISWMLDRKKLDKLA
jgi:hypothetical protein